MKVNNYLENDRLKLRALEPCDIDILYTWENTSNEWWISETRVPFSKYILTKYIENSHLDIYSIKQLRLMIDLKLKNVSVGCIDLFDFDPYNLRAGLGILIAKEFRKMNIGYEAIEIVKKYCSDVLLLHQLYCSIPVNNTSSLALFKKAGFIITGTKKAWLRSKNEMIDEFFLQYIF
ncbi:MAG: GNAT family protein [Bacteroidales bacterium]